MPTEGTSRDITIEFVESKAGFVHVSLKMPANEFDALQHALHSEKTMTALCKAAQVTGLDKVMSGSTWCATCYKSAPAGGIERHQFDAKNWFNAFWEALWLCKGSFQLAHGECPR